MDPRIAEHVEDDREREEDVVGVVVVHELDRSDISAWDRKRADVCRKDGSRQISVRYQVLAVQNSVRVLVPERRRDVSRDRVGRHHKGHRVADGALHELQADRLKVFGIKFDSVCHFFLLSSP